MHGWVPRDAAVPLTGCCILAKKQRNKKFWDYCDSSVFIITAIMTMMMTTIKRYLFHIWVFLAFSFLDFFLLEGICAIFGSRALMISMSLASKVRDVWVLPRVEELPSDVLHFISAVNDVFTLSELVLLFPRWRRRSPSRFGERGGSGGGYWFLKKVGECKIEDDGIIHTWVNVLLLSLFRLCSIITPSCTTRPSLRTRRPSSPTWAPCRGGPKRPAPPGGLQGCVGKRLAEMEMLCPGWVWARVQPLSYLHHVLSVHRHLSLTTRGNTRRTGYSVTEWSVCGWDGLSTQGVWSLAGQSDGDVTGSIVVPQAAWENNVNEAKSQVLQHDDEDEPSQPNGSCIIAWRAFHKVNEIKSSKPSVFF